MRDRLIDVLRRASYIQPFYTNDGELVTSQRRFVVDYDIAEEFADFLIEQGVIVPPCKVGQMVWFIRDNIKLEIIETLVDKIVLKHGGLYIKLGCNSTYETTCRSIGKTVFLTKEEAERALSERKGNE